MPLQVTMNTNRLNRQLRALAGKLPDMAVKAHEEVAKDILKRARRRAPRKSGSLRNSGFTRRQRRQVIVGFKAPHARIMDTGLKRPIRSRSGGKLFIPLTERGARIGPRARRAAPKGRRRKQKDFVFAESVTLPKAKYGRRKGPNLYFTGTVRKMRADGSINKKFKASMNRQIKKAVK